ncbi:AsmA family protein [Candidatus Avelusimicrobium stercoris]|uniref:AsmA family protein n=1 Tax=Candidatus Avelusimicrobium stercoris TaxID=1947924 RepID=UPI003D11F250
MKKLFKLLVKIAVVCVILLAAGLIALRIMFPPEKLKAMAVDYAKTNLQREISFDKISFNVIGVTLDNFALSENTTFQNGTFVKADKLVVKLALMPLLKKRVEISTVSVDGLDVNVIKNKDGSFNFDTLIPASDGADTPAETAQEDNSGLAFVLLADRIVLNNCNFTYKDLQTGMDASVNKLQVEIREFDLDSPFDVKIKFTTEYSAARLNMTVPVSISLRTFLANLNMPEAYVTVNDISASYKTVKLQLKGGVKNFEAPQAELTGTLSGISNATVAEILPDLPHFSLPVINMAVKASADLEKSTAVISLIKLSVMDSALSASGTAGWASATPTYSVKADLSTDLGQIVQMTDTVADFQPGGLITGSFKATDKNDGQDVSGQVTLKNVSAMYAPFTVKDLNGTVKIASINDISCPSLTGLLNGEKFSSSFSYKNIKDVMNIVFNAELDKFTLKEFPSYASAETEEGKTASAEQKTAGPELLMNIKSNIKVGPISVPYFRADGFTLNANLTGVSETMKKANGQVSFVLQPGAITDIDSFVKGNKYVKILLLPITLVRKVAGKLNVDIFPAEANAQKGEIAFTNGEGVYTFTSGVMKVDKTTFASKLTNINGSGNINFHTQALDMKVSATVLTSQTPVIIKIGGTMDNPSGKLDVLNTVGSVLGGILNYKTPGKVAASTASTAGNVATGAVKTTGQVAQTGVDTAKNVIKGIGGLFKKKSTDDTATAETETK